MGIDSAKKFITENMKEFSSSDEKAVLQITKQPYIKYLKERGISSQTIETLSTVNKDIINAAIDATSEKFASDYQDKNKVTLRIRTPWGRHDTSVIRSRTVPSSDGERRTKYGMVTVQMKMSTLLDKDIVKQCEERIKEFASS